MGDFVLEPTWRGDVSQLADEPVDCSVVRSEQILTGLVWDLRRDSVELVDGQTVVREFVVHTGAVAVLALDSLDRVLLIRQDRHPVGMALWEPIAGLLDVPGEEPWVGAARELLEEAGVIAARWDVLVDVETSPGGSSETIRCYLARDLSAAPGGRPPGSGEERTMPHTWVPLEVAAAGILSGRLTAPLTASGVLAALAARALSWSTLRAFDCPWPAREWVLGHGRARVYGPSGPKSTL